MVERQSAVIAGVGVVCGHAPLGATALPRPFRRGDVAKFGKGTKLVNFLSALSTERNKLGRIDDNKYNSKLRNL